MVVKWYVPQLAWLFFFRSFFSLPHTSWRNKCRRESMTKNSTASAGLNHLVIFWPAYATTSATCSHQSGKRVDDGQFLVLLRRIVSNNFLRMNVFVHFRIIGLVTPNAYPLLLLQMVLYTTDSTESGTHIERRRFARCIVRHGSTTHVRPNNVLIPANYRGENTSSLTVYGLIFAITYQMFFFGWWFLTIEIKNAEIGASSKKTNIEHVWNDQQDLDLPVLRATWTPGSLENVFLTHGVLHQETRHRGTGTANGFCSQRGIRDARLCKQNMTPT